MNGLVTWSLISALVLFSVLCTLQLSVLLLDIFRPVLKRACPQRSARVISLFLTGPVLVVGLVFWGGALSTQEQLLQEGVTALGRYCPELSRHCDLFLNASEGENSFYGLLLAMVLGLLAVRLGPLLRRRTSPPLLRLEDGPEDVRLRLCSMVRQLRGRYGVRMPEIRLDPSGFSRIYVRGLIRQRIVLSPEIARHLPSRELEGVLLHEWAHARRWDNLQSFVFVSLGRFCLFPRALGRLVARWRLDRELVCDDRAAALTRFPVELASALLRVSRLSVRVESHPQPVGAALVSADAAVLQARIHNLLRETSPISGARQRSFCRCDALLPALTGLWLLGFCWALWIFEPGALLQSHCWVESLIHGLTELVSS